MSIEAAAEHGVAGEVGMLIDKIGEGNMFENLDDALKRVGEVLGIKAVLPEAHAAEVARERDRAGPVVPNQ